MRFDPSLQQSDDGMAPADGQIGVNNPHFEDGIKRNGPLRGWFSRKFRACGFTPTAAKLSDPVL